MEAHSFFQHLFHLINYQRSIQPLPIYSFVLGKMMEHDLVQFLSFLILLYPICLLAYWVGTVIPHLVVGLVTSFYDIVIDPLVIVIVAFIFSSLDVLTRYTCPQQPKVNFKVKVSLTHAPILATIYRIILRELKAHFINEVKVCVGAVMSWLDWVLGISILAVLDLVGHLIEFARQYEWNDAIISEQIEGLPIRLLITGPPIRLLITGPLVLKLIEAPVVRKLIEAPPLRLFIEGPPHRLLVTGPPTRLFIEGPPVRELIAAPPTRLLITGPPSRLLITGPPPRLLIIGPPSCLIEGPSPLLLIISSPVRLLIEGPLQGPLIAGSSTELLSDAPPTRKLVNGPPITLLIAAVPIRGLINYPTSLRISALDEATSSQGEVVDEEVPASGIMVPEKVDESQTPPVIHNLASDWRSFMAADTLVVDDQVHFMVKELEAGHSQADDVALSNSVTSVSSEESSSGTDTSRTFSGSLGVPPTSVTSLELTSPVTSASGGHNGDTGSSKLGIQNNSIRDSVHSGDGDDDCDDDDNDDWEPFNPLLDFKQDGFLECITLDSLKPIGRGGFGIVWKATGVYGEKYAVKVADRTKANDASLMKEIAALERAYGSPWAVQMHHYDITEKQVLFVMDFCSGGDLMDLWETYEGPVDMEVAVFYTAEPILALQDLHRRGIMHRDIKPENLMIQNGHLRVIDFGLAETFDHDKVPKDQYPTFHRLKAQMGDSFPPLRNSSVNPHVIRLSGGTPGFAAPEVWKKEGYSFGVDYYAVGITLHGLLTDSLPYKWLDEVEGYDYDRLLIDPRFILNEVEYDFVRKMLADDPVNRLNVSEMKAHPIFKDVDWDALAEGMVDPPEL